MSLANSLGGGVTRLGAEEVELDGVGVEVVPESNDRDGARLRERAEDDIGMRGPALVDQVCIKQKNG